MINNLWFVYALSAALMWGLGYTLSEKLLRAGISPSFMLVISSLIMLPILIGIEIIYGQKNQWDKLFSQWSIIITTIAMSFLIVGGNLLILASIKEKNATLATLIEISYPFFTCLFSWILFKEVQINMTQLVGGLTILGGVFLVFLGS